MGSKYFPPQIVQDIDELQSFDGSKIRPNSVCMVKNNINQTQFRGPTTFQFVVGSGAVDATAQLVINPAAGATGQWLCIDNQFSLLFAASTINFTLADATVLFTVPVGFRLAPMRFILEIGVAWTGGAASAIGISSSNAAYNTKGDLMGAAAGDVQANLAAGFQGTIGTKLAASYATRPPVVLVAGDTFRWDLIVSQFTAGNGVLHVPCLRLS